MSSAIVDRTTEMRKTIKAIKNKRQTGKDPSVGTLHKQSSNIDDVASKAKFSVSLFLTVLLFLFWLYVAFAVIISGSFDTERAVTGPQISALILTIGFPIALLSSIYLYRNYLSNKRPSLQSPNMILASVLFGSMISYFITYNAFLSAFVTFSSIALVYIMLAVVKLALTKLTEPIRRS